MTAGGVVAGLACWDKLSLLVLVVALAVALALTDRALLRSRAALAAAAAVMVLAAPQLIAQLLHGLPMREVSANLVATQGTLVRWTLVPATIVFLGPPLLPVWWRGLVGPWRGADRRDRWLPPTALVVFGWPRRSPGSRTTPSPPCSPRWRRASPGCRRRDVVPRCDQAGGGSSRRTAWSRS